MTVCVFPNCRKATLQCKSNLRQLEIAHQAYQVDNKSTLPQPAHDSDLPTAQDEGRYVWFNALDDYLDQSQKNYADGNRNERNYAEFKQDPVWLDVPEGDKDNVRTIKMNRFLGNSDNRAGLPDVKFYTTDDFKQASATVVFLDARALDTPSATTGNIDTGGAGLFSATQIYAGLRHNGKANVVFGDGHVSSEEHEVRRSGSGYEGWYNGNNGPHDLIWDVEAN